MLAPSCRGFRAWCVWTITSGPGVGQYIMAEVHVGGSSSSHGDHKGRQEEGGPEAQ